MTEINALFEEFDLKFYIPTPNNFIYSFKRYWNDGVSFFIDLKKEMPFPLFQRFIELLPTNTLRRFTYTSKENYVNGLRYRGLPCSILVIKDVAIQESCTVEFTGKLVATLISEIPSHPIFKFLEFEALMIKNRKEKRNIPKMNQTIFLFRNYADRLSECLHPVVKNVSVNFDDVSTEKEFRKFFDIIKNSNVINVFVHIRMVYQPSNAQLVEFMRKIKKVNFTGYLACKFFFTGSENRGKRYLRWYRGDFYFKDRIYNDLEKYASKFWTMELFSKRGQLDFATAILGLGQHDL